MLSKSSTSGQVRKIVLNLWHKRWLRSILNTAYKIFNYCSFQIFSRLSTAALNQQPVHPNADGLKEILSIMPSFYNAVSCSPNLSFRNDETTDNEEVHDYSTSGTKRTQLEQIPKKSTFLTEEIPEAHVKVNESLKESQ